MNEECDPTVTTLSRTTVPPLPTTLRQRTLSLARTNLTAVASPRSRNLADYAPPRSLVPSLLISAGVVFVVDACIKMVRFFWA
jgi:hypothetical protein